jgi:hypothetical protein
MQIAGSPKKKCTRSKEHDDAPQAGRRGEAFRPRRVTGLHHPPPRRASAVFGRGPHGARAALCPVGRDRAAQIHQPPADHLPLTVSPSRNNARRRCTITGRRGGRHALRAPAGVRPSELELPNPNHSNQSATESRSGDREEHVRTRTYVAPTTDAHPTRSINYSSRC